MTSPRLPFASLSALTLGLALAGACDEAPLADDDVALRNTCQVQAYPCKSGCPCTWNGPYLTFGNFVSLDLVGEVLMDRWITSVTLGGLPVTGFGAPDGLPTGTVAGETLTGEALVGMEFVVVESGRPRTFRLTAVKYEESPVPRHRVWIVNLNAKLYPALCYDADWKPEPAILLNDMYWPLGGQRNDRPNTLTFACESSAVAKAIIGLGFDPNDKELAPYHQAATRMLTADYCGNDISWTSAGKPLLVADTLGKFPDTGEGKLEGVWDENGVLCLNDPRSYYTHAEIESSCGEKIPYCDEDLDIADAAAMGGLLVSRLP